jgi:hypothetical protein
LTSRCFLEYFFFYGVTPKVTQSYIFPERFECKEKKLREDIMSQIFFYFKNYYFVILLQKRIPKLDKTSLEAFFEGSFLMVVYFWGGGDKNREANFVLFGQIFVFF